jgi:hypothetical protein
MKFTQRRAVLKAGAGLALAAGVPGMSLLHAEEKRLLPKSPPVWTGFGLNGSAGQARFDLTRRYVAKHHNGMELKNPKAFAFLRQPLHDLLAKQNPPLVQFKDAVNLGEDFLLGMAHDYEAAVAVRRVDLQKPVTDGILFTFMAGVGMVLNFEKNVGWRVISSFSFVTRDESVIPDVTQLKEAAVDHLGVAYLSHAQAFTTFLGRFNKWNAGFRSNFFAKVTRAAVGKIAQPKLLEYKLENLLTPEFIGFEVSAAVCDGLNIPLLPFQENDALAKRYATKFSESLMTQDAIAIPETDLEFEVTLVDVIKEKVPSRQRGVITLKRQVVISFRAFERTGKAPDARTKIFQTLAAAPMDDDVISYGAPEDDTPERDFIFFDRLLYRTLSQLMAGIVNKKADTLAAVSVNYDEVAVSIPKLLELCALAR